jgi:hypothetical protein
VGRAADVVGHPLRDVEVGPAVEVVVADADGATGVRVHGLDGRPQLARALEEGPVGLLLEVEVVEAGLRAVVRRHVQIEVAVPIRVRPDGAVGADAGGDAHGVGDVGEGPVAEVPVEGDPLEAGEEHVEPAVAVDVGHGGRAHAVDRVAVAEGVDGAEAIGARVLEEEAGRLAHLREDEGRRRRRTGVRRTGVRRTGVPGVQTGVLPRRARVRQGRGGVDGRLDGAAVHRRRGGAPAGHEDAQERDGRGPHASGSSMISTCRGATSVSTLRRPLGQSTVTRWSASPSKLPRPKCAVSSL